jgi:hypothetical protein
MSTLTNYQIIEKHCTINNRHRQPMALSCISSHYAEENILKKRAGKPRQFFDKSFHGRPLLPGLQIHRY